MGGGGQGPRPDAGNRMDARQRGNAHQLHEKYKNLARDSQTQGDRVTAEYYLQYADHYFRVLNEHRVRQEEYRERQRQHEPRYDDADNDEGHESSRDDRDDDATAPISINGLPPAIGAAPMSSAQSFDDDQETEESEQEEREPRGRGRGRQPRQQNDGEGYGRESRPSRQDREDVAVEAPVAEERAERPVRRRAPRAAAPAQFDLPQTDAAEEEAPKPRRRTRRPRQEEGDTVAEADA